MNVAVDQRRSSPAFPHQGWVCAMLLGALLVGAGQIRAQDSGGKAAAAPAQGTSAAKKPGTSAKAGAPATTGDEKSKSSYSIGVSFGEQLKAVGLTSDTISAERLSQGVRDALSGKVKMTEADRENIQTAIRGVVEANHHAAATFLAENGKKKDIVTTASGLQYRVVAPGSGSSPTATDEVVVNYKGSLLDGTVFDASENHGGPATFEVGRVIPGWTEALKLMKPGAKWQLFIPPQLAYDDRPPGPPIPPGALLLFDVDLVSVKPHAAPSAQPHAPTTQPPPSK